MAAIMWLLPSPGAALTESPQAHTVIIKQMQFQPASLSVSIGDTVEWRNEDIFAHTATADNGAFSSPLIQPGASWSTTVTTAGSMPYHCTPHPNMRAQLTVTNGQQQSTVSGANRAAGGSLKWRPPTRPEMLHPIFVNFTAALLPLAFLSDLLGLVFRRSRQSEKLHSAGFWMTLYAAIITPLTASAGWWWKHAQASALPHNLILVHQWLGTSAVLLFVLLAVWRWQIYRRAVAPSMGYMALAFVAVLALIYQGSLGGAMLFGQ